MSFHLTKIDQMSEYDTQINDEYTVEYEEKSQQNIELETISI